MKAVHVSKILATASVTALALVAAIQPGSASAACAGGECQPFAFGSGYYGGGYGYYGVERVRSSYVPSSPFRPVPHPSVAPSYALRTSMEHYYYTSWGGPCCGPVGEMQLYSGY